MRKEITSSITESRNHPRLVEVFKHHLAELEEPENSLMTICQQVYNAELNTTTNILTINAQENQPAQLLQAIFNSMEQTLRLQLLKSGVFQLASYGIMGNLGELFSSPIEGILGIAFDEIENALEPSRILNLIQGKAESFTSGLLEGNIENQLDERGEQLNSHFLTKNKLHLTVQAKEKLTTLANQLSNEHTPHQAMEFTLELMQTLSIGAPKVIIVNNPFALDSSSLALVSMLLSRAKDANLSSEENCQFSIILNYSERQPSFQLSPSSKPEEYRLYRLRHLAQRYSLYEQPGERIPVPAIRASAFAGRGEELSKLYTGHKAFHQLCIGNAQAQSHWTVIRGEPGVGKTALVKKHLEQLAADTAYSVQSQITLTLLNQIGHSSEVTGLASLQHTIAAEMRRLCDYYEAHTSWWQKQLDEKQKDLCDSVRQITKARKLSHKLMVIGQKAAVHLGGTPLKAAISVAKSEKINASAEQSFQALNEGDTRNCKQQQFELLDDAIADLKQLARNIDPGAHLLPLFLCIDDLQWLDELSAEYILTRLVPYHQVKILATTRTADGVHSFEEARQNPEKVPYKLAIFNHCQLGEMIEKVTSKVCAIHLQGSPENIWIRGLDLPTLTELIKGSYLDVSEHQADKLAKGVFGALSETNQSGDEISEYINSLFAVETLNLISDPEFYRRRNLAPLITQVSKGRYRISDIEQHCFEEQLCKIFEQLNDVHRLSYSQSQTGHEANTKFTLTTHAVFEERLLLIHEHFERVGNNANSLCYSLLLATALGTPFDTGLVARLVTRCSELDLNEEPLLAPLTEYLGGPDNHLLGTAQTALLQEAFEILVRLPAAGSRHNYRHKLFTIFFRQKLEHVQRQLLDSDHQAAINRWVDISLTELSAWMSEQIATGLSPDAQHDLKVFVVNCKIHLTELAVQNDKTRWLEEHLSNKYLLAKLYSAMNNDLYAVGLLEDIMNHSITPLFRNNEEKWLPILTDAGSRLCDIYQDDPLKLSQTLAQCTFILSAVSKQYANEKPEVYFKLNYSLAKGYYVLGDTKFHKDIFSKLRPFVRHMYEQDPLHWSEAHANTEKLFSKYYLAEDDQLNAELAIGDATVVYDSMARQEPNSPEKWMPQYVDLLVESANVYRTNSGEQMHRIAIIYVDRALDLLQPAFNTSPKKWTQKYVDTLEFKAKLILDGESPNDATGFAESAVDILLARQQSQPEVWNGRFAESLLTLARCQLFLNKNTQALMNASTAYELLDELSQDNPSRYAESTVQSQILLANIHANKDNDSAQRFEAKAIEQLEYWYRQHPSYWAKRYITSLVELTKHHAKRGNKEGWLKTSKHALQLMQKQFRQEHSNFDADNYHQLIDLAESCPHFAALDSISFEHKLLSFLRKLSSNNPNKWSYHYCYQLISYSMRCQNLERWKVSIGTLLEAVKLSGSHLKSDKENWALLHSRSLRTLALSLLITGKVSDGEKLLSNAYRLVTPIYKRGENSKIGIDTWQQELDLTYQCLMQVYVKGHEHHKSAQLTEHYQRVMGQTIH